MKGFAVICLGVIAHSAALAASHPPKTYRLEATPSTVAYGYYWSEAPPVLHIDSGDIIDVDTLLTNTPTGLAKAGVPDDKIQSSLKAIVSEVTGDRRGPGGHILTGPVYVEGAEPGDVLEVKILSIDLALDYGYNGCSGFLPDNCESGIPVKILALDRKAMTAEFLPGIVIPLKPFYGSIGVAPAPELGRLSSNPPGRHAGNLDNRELVAGSTLYIPIFARGALFEIGDGHAAQGDGEVCINGIECPLDVTLRFRLHKHSPLAGPIVEASERTARDSTSDAWVVVESGIDLAGTARAATLRMIELLVSRWGFSEVHAYLLCSVALKMRLSQVVNEPMYTVSAALSKQILPGRELFPHP